MITSKETFNGLGFHYHTCQQWPFLTYEKRFDVHQIFLKVFSCIYLFAMKEIRSAITMQTAFAWPCFQDEKWDAVHGVCYGQVAVGPHWEEFTDLQHNTGEIDEKEEGLSYMGAITVMLGRLWLIRNSVGVSLLLPWQKSMLKVMDLGLVALRQLFLPWILK